MPPIRLNRYIANAGICSRRKADELISGGLIQVNGKVITILGTKINPEDVVTYKDRKLQSEKLIYLLLNKPKDYITTTVDPQERKTVMELIKNAGTGRLYPIGRLDRNSTGVLLFTNDGDIAQKLSHPSGKIRKVYHIRLDKNIQSTDIDSLLKGIELEDGLAMVDKLNVLEDKQGQKIEILLHSGRNRILRRMFEKLGYEVKNLDRFAYGGITHKFLLRGKWRFLTEREVFGLKRYMN